MKRLLAALLCLTVRPAFGAEAAGVAFSSSPARAEVRTLSYPAIPALIYPSPRAQAPPEDPRRQEELSDLKKLRAAGGATAGAGLGLMGYALLMEMTGPIGLAAGLLFFGGLAAYMAHRQLTGQAGPRDLKLVAPAPPAAPSEPPARSTDSSKSSGLLD